jgi:hypothetical protein
MGAVAVVTRWLHSSSGRSKRSTSTKSGYFCLEHEATGRYYVDKADDVSKVVDKQLIMLSKGTHPCKLLNILYEKDNVIVVYEYAVKSKTKIDKGVDELINDPERSYLTLNHVKPKRKRRGTSS